MVRSPKCDVAWRTLDAQYWGVPQRRKRIFLVADFRVKRRPEVLFEPESQPWHSPQSRDQRKEASRDTRESFEEASRTIYIEGNGARPSHMGDGYKESDVMYTLNTIEKHGVAYGFEPGIISRCGGRLSKNLSTTLRADMGYNQETVVYGITSYNSNSMLSDNPNSGIYEADTSRTLDINGGNPACNQGGMAVVQNAYCIGDGQVMQPYMQDKVGTLNCMHGQQAVMYTLDEAPQGVATQSYSELKLSDKGAALRASGGAYGGGSENYALCKVTGD